LLAGVFLRNLFGKHAKLLSRVYTNASETKTSKHCPAKPANQAAGRSSNFLFYTLSVPRPAD